MKERLPPAEAAAKEWYNYGIPAEKIKALKTDKS